MEENNNILKWFNNDLSKSEEESLKQSKVLDDTLLKIEHYSKHLNAPEVDANNALSQFKSRQLKKKDTKVRALNYKLIYRVAAMLTIMLCASYFIFFNNTVVYKTDIAQTQNLTLPDQSEVILNAKSKLSYNKKNWDNNRNLDLKGEAYFKVEKGQKFTVNTNAGTVQVLGTQFNVKQRNNYFEVQCYEGLVAVTNQNNTVKLTPGKTFRLINGVVENLDDFNANAPSWINAESSFVKVPLSNVIKELEIQYNITIDYKNIDTNMLFTGAFTHKDKNIALQAVTIPLNISYKIDGKKVTFYKYEGK